MQRGTRTPLAGTEKSHLDGGFKGVTCIKFMRPRASTIVRQRTPMGSDRCQCTFSFVQRKENQFLKCSLISEILKRA